MLHTLLWALLLWRTTLATMIMTPIATLKWDRVEPIGSPNASATAGRQIYGSSAFDVTLPSSAELRKGVCSSNPIKEGGSWLTAQCCPDAGR
jgi:hypothetical protein